MGLILIRMLMVIFLSPVLLLTVLILLNASRSVFISVIKHLNLIDQCGAWCDIYMHTYYRLLVCFVQFIRVKVGIDIHKHNDLSAV